MPDRLELFQRVVRLALAQQPIVGEDHFVEQDPSGDRADGAAPRAALPHRQSAPRSGDRERVVELVVIGENLIVEGTALGDAGFELRHGLGVGLLGIGAAFVPERHRQLHRRRLRPRRPDIASQSGTSTPIPKVLPRVGT